MAADDERLARLAGEILDGANVDWDAAESDLSSSARIVFEELRAVAALTSIQRHGHSSVVLPGPDALPVTWGHLVLKSVLASGAFGTVYGAWDTRLEREVALKLLPASQETLQEARLLAKIRHPNVVTIYGADEIHGCIGLWMEFVRGVTLEDLLAANGPLPPNRVSEIGAQLCAALSALHDAHLVHRDVKAHNVMVEQDGRVVLMDFGSASITAADIVGTPLYLAPEIFTGQPASPASDIYSVGVLLFRLLTGDFPVTGSTLADVRRAHAAERGPTDLRRRIASGVPRRLADAIGTALRRNPADRFESATAMRAALTPRKYSAAIAAALIVSGTAAAGAMLTLGGWNPNRPLPQAPGFVAPDSPTSRQFRLPDNAAVFNRGLAFSGTHLSFADTDGSVSVLDTDTNAATIVRQSGSGAFAEMSIMSPDAGAVAYQWWTPDNQSELRMVQRDGTNDRLLLRSGDLDYVMPIEWSRDGRDVLVLEGERSGSCIISAISVQGGSRRVLRRLPHTPAGVSLSTDGRFLAYDEPVGTGASRRIQILNLDSSEAVTLSGGRSADRYPLWTPDGQVFFLSDRSGTVDAWVQPMRDGRPEGSPVVALRNQVRVTPLGFSSSGNYYYRLQSGTFDLVTLPIGRDDSGDPEPRRFGGRFSGSNAVGTYSPDDRRLAYISVRDGVRAGWERSIVIQDLATGAERDLSPPIDLGFAPVRWSPSGRSLLVRGRHRPTNRRGLYLLDPESGAVTRTVLTFLERDQTEIAPIAWGPDDQTVWFQQTGRGIVSRDIVSGVERVISAPQERVRYTGFGADPIRGQLATSLLAAPATRLGVIEDGRLRVLMETKLPENLRLLGWSADGNDIYALRGAQGGGAAPLQLWRVSASAPGSEEKLADLPGATFTNPPFVNGAGTEVTYTSGTPRAEFWLVEHFVK